MRIQMALSSLTAAALMLAGGHANAKPLSSKAEALIERAFADLKGQPAVDYHVHLLGLGDSGGGAWANQRLRSWAYPLRRLKAKIFFRSSGISDENQADTQYVERLLSLADEFPASLHLAILAFDYHHDANGRADLEKSEFHTPSDYVIDVAKRHPGRFIPIVSVHPYDPQAIQKLEAYAAQGARIVKWLPNAQGMDPSDPTIDPYYQAMVGHGMALLCHTGRESAVDSPDWQRLGNPLLLRRALDNGVTVIMAHAGNRGKSDDLDRPGVTARNFDLWLRMMDDPRYKDILFADISATTQTIRSRRDLRVLLERTDLHPRLVNGSDYPLPALPYFITTLDLAIRGFITNRERRALNEIKRKNPLLFDFVLKRSLRHPENQSGFPPQLFMANPALANASPVLQNLAATTRTK